jgi:GMP synthase (glutamine-hydrolysing)
MHADFETPGVITSWASDQKYSFTLAKPYREESLPPVETFDFLIVMGGPQSPLHIKEAPYLLDEIKLIQDAIKHNKRVLGFCLGAQLIGEALGAKTERSPEKEMGVYPLSLTEAGKNDLLLEGFSPEFPVIHWHNDMPGLTKESALLAYSAGCPRQIIRYSPLVYGFQCHLEITKEGIEEMIKACPEDLKPSLYTQSQ